MTLRRALSALALFGFSVTLCAGEVGPYEAKIRRNVGVGLGTKIFGKIGDGLMSQACAATTNGSFGNQTFAVTSGTLGADEPGKVARLELTNYMHDHMDTVARDVAAGRGEGLETVLDILAVPTERRSEVTIRLQSSFADIYTSDDITHDVVAERIATLATRP